VSGERRGSWNQRAARFIPDDVIESTGINTAARCHLRSIRTQWRNGGGLYCGNNPHSRRFAGKSQRLGRRGL
jgi:hypothetical protein